MFYGKPQMSLAEWNQKYDWSGNNRDYEAECNDPILAMLEDHFETTAAVQGRYRDRVAIESVESAKYARDIYKRKISINQQETSK